MPPNEILLSPMLEAVSAALDIPDHAYNDAVLKYQDVGRHLGAEDSVLHDYDPQIYPQGSFRLGTVVQPYGRDGEYDIDLVCHLEIDKDDITQKDLKDGVGARLKQRADLDRILEESRRCWVLNYPARTGMPGFHMDVLPSIPNPEQLPTGILLTDTDLVRWQKSNPIAYADWFRKRMEVVFARRKIALAESMRASVEQVPDWRVKTPLQRVVQILKRHRDVHFQRNPEVKPVSIILTTLAAHAYNNQEDTAEALVQIAKSMPDHIENRNGRWWVENPVEPGENFADKWNEYPERRQAFMAWLTKLEQDIAGLQSGTLENRLSILEKSIGKRTLTEAASTLGVRAASSVVVATPSISATNSDRAVLEKLERAEAASRSSSSPWARR